MIKNWSSVHLHLHNLKTLKKKALVVLTGPTAVGKTTTAIALARRLDTEIISADSRQFYREMTIGTAKPVPEEMENVPHHFIDFLAIEEPFNAYDFEVAALKKIRDLFKERDHVIMTGGSGLYIDAVCHGIDFMPDIPGEVRARIKAEMKDQGLDHALERLRSVDPEYYADIDRKNPVRVQRGLEIYEVSGKPYSSFRKGRSARREFNIVKIGLERDREELYERIDLRMDEMIEQGLFAEAGQLFERRYLNALNTVGYKEIFGYLEGNYDREEAIRLLKRNSRRYAKRQMTWFKRDPDFKWFHPDQVEEIIRFVESASSAS